WIDGLGVVGLGLVHGDVDEADAILRRRRGGLLPPHAPDAQAADLVAAQAREEPHERYGPCVLNRVDVSLHAVASRSREIALLELKARAEHPRPARVGDHPRVRLELCLDAAREREAASGIELPRDPAPLLAVVEERADRAEVRGARPRMPRFPVVGALHLAGVVVADAHAGDGGDVGDAGVARPLRGRVDSRVVLAEPATELVEVPAHVVATLERRGPMPALGPVHPAWRNAVRDVRLR